MPDALIRVYHPEIPDFIRRAAAAPEMLRLRNVGMNCGCEYTSFERFLGLKPYSRYAHSLGVGLITWHFTGDPRAALAGLLHDIASPCFAHVVDFLNGDYLNQESTEEGTARMIEESGALQAVLRDMGLRTADVSDYHAYPIADNDTPRLSADRLEYTLGNAINFGIEPFEAVKAFYGDLYVALNGDGLPELAFRDRETALRFARCALKCSAIYVSDADRGSMQALSELLGDAIRSGVLRREDLWRTEPEVIARLKADARFRGRWQAFRDLNAMEVCESGPAREGWRVIHAKKRWIDPLAGKPPARVSAFSEDFARAARAFLDTPQDYAVRAITK